MEAKVYPNLEAMCRLCLKENAGTVCIFASDENSEKFKPLSIPMRIMTCAALEVQSFDAFPKKICSDCRLQLEKSYYFRKRSQVSDAKIRKHLRLIAMGKTSEVFDHKPEDDDYDELEYQDSLKFIKEQEEQQKQIEKLKYDYLISEMKAQYEEELQNTKEKLRTTCRQELIPEIREKLRKEMQIEIKKKLEESLRKELSEQCISQAKESLRAEVRDECRQLEIKCLLDDLQLYLTNKHKLSDTFVPNKLNTRKRVVPQENKENPAKKCSTENSQKIEVASMEPEIHNSNTEKGNIVLTDNISEDYQNTNDGECDSEDNFLIYGMEEDFDVQKASSNDKVESDVQEVEYDDDEFHDGNIVTYEKIGGGDIEANEDTGETTLTTSYQIEDNEDGEIKFLKKSIEIINANGDKDRDQNNEYKNIMVINIDEGIENEYVDHFEEVEPKATEGKTETSHKLKKTADKKGEEKIIRTTSSISETTYLTKTIVNKVRRTSDTPKIFKCQDCPMAFATKLSFERHLRTHRKVELTGVTHQCPECHIVVSCGSALTRHMNVHSEKKPFACNLCDKAFVQREILKRHMQTHTGIKPHQCPHCDRAFAQRINLRQHINRTHLEEPHIQQHSCCLCPKRFNHASGLSRHMASHSGVAFQCSECDRTFGDRSSIRRHIVNMHGNARPGKHDTKAKTSTDA